MVEPRSSGLQADGSQLQPLISHEPSLAQAANNFNGPFTLLQAFIVQSVKGMQIPGTVIRQRHWGMAFTFISTVIAFYELIRYSMDLFPISDADKSEFLLGWVILNLVGSLVGMAGTFMLHKGLILAASLLFCCAMAPATPNMIVLTQGEEYLYFIGLTVFMLVVGGLEITLFSNLTDELDARVALATQPSSLGSIASHDAERIQNASAQVRLEPCGCLLKDLGEKDDEFQSAAVNSNAEGGESLVP